MKSELIVDVQPHEIAIALTEDDRLQEVNREKRNQDNFSVGNIYYGRVKKVLPALNAVFVDVGYEKEAFLHYLDLGAQFRTTATYVKKAVSDRRRVPAMDKYKREPEVGKEGQIGDVLKVGDPILVQVTKEPINTKGPRLTAEISIAGRNMVLIPFADGVMVSQKIKREAERSRLKQLLQSIKPHGFGIIVRTVAEDKRVAELDNELRLLVQRWEDTVKSLQKKEPVSLVSEEIGRTIGIIRDVLSPDFTSIQINDEEVYQEVRQYLELIAPESAKIVKRYDGTQPIFDKFDITRQMKTGLGRVVGFKHGGYLIIDRTEALFSIDVNSGSKKLYDDQEENAFQFNMLAAEELAHQLRLRDIGGIIIVDFIDMDSKDHQQQLYDYMRKLMDRDRARHNVLPLSKFGLMQITRQRVRPAVEVEVMEVCPTCMGKGKIQPTLLFTDQVEETIEQMVENHGKGLRLHLHPFVYSYATRGWLTSLSFKWRRKYGVKLVENQSLGMLEMRFEDSKNNPLALPTATNAPDNAPKADKAQKNGSALANTAKANQPTPTAKPNASKDNNVGKTESQAPSNKAERPTPSQKTDDNKSQSAKRENATSVKTDKAAVSSKSNAVQEPSKPIVERKADQGRRLGEDSEIQGPSKPIVERKEELAQVANTPSSDTDNSTPKARKPKAATKAKSTKVEKDTAQATDVAPSENAPTQSKSTKTRRSTKPKSAKVVDKSAESSEVVENTSSPTHETSAKVRRPKSAKTADIAPTTDASTERTTTEPIVTERSTIAQALPEAQNAAQDAE